MKNIVRIKEGFKRLVRKKIWICVPIVYILLMLFMRNIMCRMFPKMIFLGITNFWEIMINILVTEITFIGLLCFLIFLGTPYEARSIEEKLKKIRMCDADGCPPMLISKIRRANDVVYTFYSPVISKERFVNEIDSLRTILKGHIEKDWIKEGKNPQYIIIETVSAKKNYLM